MVCRGVSGHRSPGDPVSPTAGQRKGVAQEVFDSNIGLTLAIVLLLLRVLAMLGALRAGAEGGY